MAEVAGIATGGVANVFGSLAEGKAAYQAGQYNANVAEQNAALSRQEAAEEARRSRVLARKTIGDMRANYGASGVALEGSAIDVLGESAAAAELDALTIEHGGEIRARMFENDATMERFKGVMGRNSSYLKAAGTMGSSAGKVAGMV